MAIATPQQVQETYKKYIGREATPQELAHHASSGTGLEHLTSWAQSQGGQTTASSPMANYSSALTGLLKGYQGVDTTGLYKKKANIYKGQLDRIQKMTPEELRSLSPEQQKAIRTGEVSALAPELETVQTQISKAEQLGQNFLSTIGIARQLQQDQITLQDKAKERALEAIQFAAQSGTSLDQAQLAEISQLTGYTPEQVQGYYDRAKKLADYETELASLNIKKTKADIYKAYKDTSTSTTDPLVQAVMNNPEIYNQLTATQKGNIAAALSQLGFTQFGKPLSDTAIKEITQSENALTQLQDLRTLISDNQDKLGPLIGLEALNPYSEKRRIQADLDRVKQRVGKALEGGVLRKEDEEKYKKILAQITDTPETALYKTDQLIKDIENQVSTYKAAQQAGGREISYTPAISGTPEAELEDDINIAIQRNDYGTREALGRKLANLYDEFSYDEIMNYVYQLIPDQ